MFSQRKRTNVLVIGEEFPENKNNGGRVKSSARSIYVLDWQSPRDNEGNLVLLTQSPAEKRGIQRNQR